MYIFTLVWSYAIGLPVYAFYRRKLLPVSLAKKQVHETAIIDAENRVFEIEGKVGAAILDCLTGGEIQPVTNTAFIAESERILDVGFNRRKVGEVTGYSITPVPLILRPPWLLLVGGFVIAPALLGGAGIIGFYFPWVIFSVWTLLKYRKSNRERVVGKRDCVKVFICDGEMFILRKSSDSVIPQSLMLNGIRRIVRYNTAAPHILRSENQVIVAAPLIAAIFSLTIGMSDKKRQRLADDCYGIAIDYQNKRVSLCDGLNQLTSANLVEDLNTDLALNAK